MSEKQQTVHLLRAWSSHLSSQRSRPELCRKESFWWLWLVAYAQIPSQLCVHSSPPRSSQHPRVGPLCLLPFSLPLPRAGCGLLVGTCSLIKVSHLKSTDGWTDAYVHTCIYAYREQVSWITSHWKTNEKKNKRISYLSHGSICDQWEWSFGNFCLFIVVPLFLRRSWITNYNILCHHIFIEHCHMPDCALSYPIIYLLNRYCPPTPF